MLLKMQLILPNNTQEDKTLKLENNIASYQIKLNKNSLG